MGNNSSTTSQAPHSLNVTALSWRQDSHCLFDFESKDIIKKKLNIKKSGFLSRSSNDEISLADQPSSEQESLLQINQQKNQFILKNGSMDNQDQVGLSEKSVWIIVNSFKQNDQEKGLYELNNNDQIKIGRVRLRVKQINPVGDFSNQDSNESECDESKYGIKPTEDIQCRICLGDSYTEQNPFISPCACTGSVKHIHLKCLKIWLQNKLVIKQSSYFTEYEWKNLECELCKSPLQPYIDYNNQRLQTFAISNPQCPYIVLEKLQKDSNKSKSQLVISFPQKEEPQQKKNKKEKLILKIGRGLQSHIRINDISVSREHAYVIFQNNKFFLKDENSKFGTLALVRDPISFSSQWNKVSIQIGKTVLQLKLKKKSSLFSYKIKLNNLFDIISSHSQEDNQSDQKLEQLQTNKIISFNSENGLQSYNGKQINSGHLAISKLASFE